MARLQKEEEQRTYERMINPPPPQETFAQRFPGFQHAHLFPTSAEDLGGSDDISFADTNRQMTLIINILVSVVACSVAIWIAAKHWSVPSRLGLSMGGSGLVAAAEAVVYLGYLRRVKQAREQGKKVVEVKEIMRTWIIGEDDNEKSQIAPVRSSTAHEDVIRRRKPISK